MAMDSGLMTLLAQFGPAGLIGFLWLYERRSGATRERQLSEAHRTVMSLDRQLDSLLTAAKDNTRAINSLERSQHHLLDLLGNMRFRRSGSTASTCQ